MKPCLSFWQSLAHAWLSRVTRVERRHPEKSWISLRIDLRGISVIRLWMRKFFSSRRKSFITGAYFVSINYSIYQRMYHVWTIIFPYCSREFPSKISWKIWLNVRRILLYSLISLLLLLLLLCCVEGEFSRMKYANRNFVRLKNNKKLGNFLGILDLKTIE